MRLSSYTLGRATDDLNRLRESGEIQYNSGWVGCCRRYFLIFPNDQHKYYYNPNKLISDSLKKKVFTYLYTPTNNMSESLNKKTTVQDKNKYVKSLIEDFKQIHSGTRKTAKIDLTKVNVKQVVKLIQQNIDNKKLSFELNDGKLYMLNDNTINKLTKGLIDENAIANQEAYGSDKEFTDLANLTKELTLKLVEAKGDDIPDKRLKTKTRPGGGFFKFMNTTKFDFSRYGIFTEIKAENYNDNCLYIACELAGMPEHQLQMLKIFVMNRVVPKCKLKEICETLQICFKLTSVNSSDRTTTETIGDKNNTCYHIGLVCEHYFIIEKTNYTSYCLYNYEDVKDIDGCNIIWTKYHGEYKKSYNKFIDSFKLIKILLENKDKLLEPIQYNEEIMNTQFYDKVEEYKTLEYPEQCVKYQEYKHTQKEDYYKVFFDFETDTSEYTHKPYLVRFETEDNEQREFIGKDCAIDMLNNLPDKKNIMLIAHNANYDCRFLLKHLSQERCIVKGGRFLSTQCVFYRNYDKKQPIKIKIKDSCKLIPMQLKEFGKSFKLSIKKDIMPYKIYTQENISKVYIPILEAIHHISDKDRDQFIDNIDRWQCRGEGHRFNEFNIIKYSSEYCKLDCSVLHKGYDIFRDWMLKYTELDIDNYITIQSLASDYKLKEGCYDKVATFSGVIQHYISNCIVGGRCMTNSNKMYHVKRKLADFDACSLYPSAMNRMLGYLIGKPKILDKTQLNYNFLKNTDGYFIRVKITNVGKHRQFPLMSKYNANGVRMFTNDMTNQIIYIDKTGLEDAINFQSIDFEVIDGYYFNNGRNQKINETIQHLYNLRKTLKKDKNPAQMVIKLLMNSMYGKTILKPIEVDTVVVPEYSFDKYINYNYNFIQSCIKVNDKYYVKKIKTIINHYNYCHCGVEVLSMSKRIMNEVMTLAEDLKLSIYYQDTDSMHINYEEVDVLAKEFKLKYNRELIGEDMGSFHVDFDMDGASGEIYAKESYFIAKKVYIDILESTNKDGETINSDHIRMKSVPTSCIKYTSQDKKLQPLELYKQLYNGTSINFDLTEGGNNCGFKYERDLTVRSYEESEFNRCIGFSNDVERIQVF